MREDPIVAEVHRVRDALAAEFDYDLKAIFDDLRSWQLSLGDRLIPVSKASARMQPPKESTITTSIPA